MFETSETPTPLAAYWVATGTLQLDTTAQAPTGESEATVFTVGRGVSEGLQLAPLPLRHLLIERFPDKATEIDALLAGLRVTIGPAEAGTAHLSSRLLQKADPETGLPAGNPVEIQTLQSGARFPVRLELAVPAGTDESEITSAFLALVNLLLWDTARPCYLGSHTRDGMGRFGLQDPTVLRYDLTTPEGWEALSESAGSFRPATDRPGVTPSPPPYAATGGSQSFPSDTIPSLQVQIVGEIASSLLVPGLPPQPDSPEVAHLTEKATPILPGSALRAALWQGAYRILSSLGISGGKTWLDSLFDGERLRFTEGKIEGGQIARLGRLRVDRFTGGAADDGVSEMEVCIGGRVTLSLTLAEPTDAEIGLLLLLVRDLLDGRLPVGRQGAAGFGVLRGSAQITLPRGVPLTLANGAFDGVPVVVLDTRYLAPLREMATSETTAEEA